MGRPKKLKKEEKDFALTLYEKGCTDIEVAKSINIHPSTLYREKLHDSEFCKSILILKREHDWELLHNYIESVCYPTEIEVYQDDLLLKTENNQVNRKKLFLFLKNRKFRM